VEKSLNALLTEHMSKSEFGKQLSEMTASTKLQSRSPRPSSGCRRRRRRMSQLGERLRIVEELVGRAVALLERLAPEERPAAAPVVVARTRRHPATKGKKP
jgi:hypothetical protein